MEKKFHFNIHNATMDEEKIVNSIVKYIDDNYADRIDISKLLTVEIVDALPNDSSGRAIGNKIILARKNGLEYIDYNKISDTQNPDNFKMGVVFSTIYHELWHISTWDNYYEMYEYVMKKDDGKDLFLAFAYMYWIEYIAHIETVFMEVPEVMKEFCVNFVNRKWHRIEGGYIEFIKALPYYLIRAGYINVFEELTPNIQCDELRNAVYEFNYISEELFKNNGLTDMEKASIVKDMIVKLFE